MKEIIAIILTIIISACTPIRSIYIIPDKNNENNLTIFARESFKPTTTKTHALKTDITLPLKVQDSKVYVFYGDGYWCDSLLNNIAQSIDSIVLIKKNMTLRLTKYPEIYDFLYKKRKGGAKQLIKIKLK